MSAQENSVADTKTTTKPKIKTPDLYKVILKNDDYTPMDFVVQVLVEIFAKSREEAVKIMMYVHNNGQGVAGIYTKEIATQKAQETIYTARQFGYPLLATVEPA